MQFQLELKLIDQGLRSLRWNGSRFGGIYVAKLIRHWANAGNQCCNGRMLVVFLYFMQNKYFYSNNREEYAKIGGNLVGNVFRISSQLCKKPFNVTKAQCVQKSHFSVWDMFAANSYQLSVYPLTIRKRGRTCSWQIEKNFISIHSRFRIIIRRNCYDGMLLHTVVQTMQNHGKRQPDGNCVPVVETAAVIRPLW